MQVGPIIAAVSEEWRFMDLSHWGIEPVRNALAHELCFMEPLFMDASTNHVHCLL